MKVHQFHYSLADADAVSSILKFYQHALALDGISGNLFCAESHRASFPVSDWKELRNEKDSILILHHSHGNPILDRILDFPGKVILSYHNITPSHFFSHDPVNQRLCDLGRMQLEILKTAVDAALTSSDYNSMELIQLGFKNVRTAPLMDLTERKPIFRSLDREARRLLFVGRLSPHKDQALLIESMRYLLQISDDYRLDLVGGGDPLYHRFLKSLVRRLGLEKYVRICGKISDAELENLYESSDAFVCVSQHEGFCIPLVDAMQRDLTIITSGGTGTEGTLGESGWRVTSRCPDSVAAAIHTVLSNPTFVSFGKEKQRSRYAQLTNEQNTTRLREVVRQLL